MNPSLPSAFRVAPIMPQGPITKASDHAHRACPDCGDEMFRIKLIDATGSGISGEGISHVELCYAAEDADASFLTRTIAKAGTVKAVLCGKCGRIVLFSDTPPRFFQAQE
jgi:hypothetical protein